MEQVQLQVESCVVQVVGLGGLVVEEHLCLPEAHEIEVVWDDNLSLIVPVIREH